MGRTRHPSVNAHLRQATNEVSSAASVGSADVRGGPGNFAYAVPVAPAH